MVKAKQVIAKDCSQVRPRFVPTSQSVSGQDKEKPAKSLT